MRMKPARFVALVFAAFVGLAAEHAVAAERSLGRGPGRPDEPKARLAGWALLRPGVRVLNEHSLRMMERAPERSSTLVFERASPGFGWIRAGTVVVAGVSDFAPEGLLRRVTRTWDYEGMVHAETEPATLEDVFWFARAAATVPLAEARVAASTVHREGASVVAQGYEGGFSLGAFEVDLLDVVLYDVDGDPETVDDQVRVTGTVGIEPRFDLELDVSWATVRRVSLTNTNELYTSLVLDGQVEFASVDQEVTIATVRFAPITVFLNGVPLVFTPVLEVKAGLSGQATGEVHSSVSAAVSLTAGVVYERGAWKGFSDLPDALEDVDVQWEEPRVSLGAELEVRAGPKLSVLFYGLAGPFAGVEGYSAAAARLLSQPAWTLDVGVRGSVGVEGTFPVIGDTASYSIPLFDRRWRVAEGDLWP